MLKVYINLARAQQEARLKCIGRIRVSLNVLIGLAELQYCSCAGTNSYVLFTLEKLVTRLMKHLQQMLSEDVSCKLLDLWKYESARGAGYTDAVNYANGHVILHDDTCFRFEARKDDHLTIQQLFVDKSEVAGGEHRGTFVMHQLSQIHPGRSQQTLDSALRSTQRSKPFFCVAISRLVRELQHILLLCCLIVTAFADGVTRFLPCPHLPLSSQPKSHS